MKDGRQCIKASLVPGDEGYDPAYPLHGNKKPPVVTEQQRLDIESKVRALAYKRRIAFDKKNNLPVRY